MGITWRRHANQLLSSVPDNDYVVPICPSVDVSLPSASATNIENASSSTDNVDTGSGNTSDSHESDYFDMDESTADQSVTHEQNDTVPRRSLRVPKPVERLNL